MPDESAYNPDMSKDAMISARCHQGRKDQYARAAEQLGYQDFSAFLLDTLDTVCGNVDSEGWECRLVHIEGDRIVGIGEQSTGVEPIPVTAYPVVAPLRLWQALERILG